jgi:hypothetical protein
VTREKGDRDREALVQSVGRVEALVQSVGRVEALGEVVADLWADRVVGGEGRWSRRDVLGG